MSKEQIPYGYCHCGCGQKTSLATRTKPRLGHIKGEPVAYILGHARWTSRTPAEERFWEKVERRGADECWNWQGGKSSLGYGIFGAGGKNFIASRFSYQLAHGPIPDDLCVLHKCDNPSCVNPAHLWLGSRADNTADMIAKGRRVEPSVRVGIAHHKAKFTEEQVRNIRVRHSAGETFATISQDFGVNQSTISRIVYRKSWKHVK